MNKTLKFLMIGTVMLTSSNLMAEAFNWSEYKKTLPEDIIEQKTMSAKELTKKSIKKQHGVDVDRRTLAEIKKDRHTKTLEIAFTVKNPKSYTQIGTLTSSSEKTSAFGISLTGRLDFFSIGKDLGNTYATVDVFQENVWVGIAKRVQADNRLGLFSDIGAGLMFQMQETDRAKDVFMYGFVKVGYDFEDWTIKAGLNIPSDSFNSGFIDKSLVTASIGYRF